MKRIRYILAILTTAVTLQAQTVKERIEVVTDKELYLSGEQMGIKLYTTDDTGLSISFSRVAYVELNGDKENNLRLKVEMNQGQGQAVVKLPYTLSTGTYRLTAYTRWMRNEGEKVFFNKQIGIFNSIIKSNIFASIFLINVSYLNFVFTNKIFNNFSCVVF